MATRKQKLAIDNLVENRGNVSLAMKDAGYDLTTAKNPKNLTDSKGFKELMQEYGLTEGFITRALVDDIKAKPKHRFLELNLGAEILGMKEHEQSKTPGVVIVNVSGDIAKKYGVITSPINDSL